MAPRTEEQIDRVGDLAEAEFQQLAPSLLTGLGRHLLKRHDVRTLARQRAGLRRQAIGRRPVGSPCDVP